MAGAHRLSEMGNVPATPACIAGACTVRISIKSFCGMIGTRVANGEDPHQAEDDQANAEEGLLRERDHQAKQYGQDWVFTDVVDGPWKDESGVLRTVARNLQNVTVKFEDDHVNAFRLQSVMEKYEWFDIVVCFGTWPNVLTDEICQKHNKSCPTPGSSRRGRIQGCQKDVFNYPQDFLVAFTNAVMAQTQASFVLVGPRHYTWQAVAKCDRPCERFMLTVDELHDYYQGKEEMRGPFLCTYWPKSDDKKVGRDAGSLVRILAMHERVLCLSAGRGVAWSNVLNCVEEELCTRMVKGEPPRACGSEPPCAWGSDVAKRKRDYAVEHYVKVNGSYNAIVDQCPRQRCVGAWLCHVCLRQIKRWSSIDEKIWPVRTRWASSQTGEEDLDEEAEEAYWDRHLARKGINTSA